jgi:hypothetical protein
MNPIQLWQKYPRLCRMIYLTTSGSVSEWRACCYLAEGPEAKIDLGGEVITAHKLVTWAFKARRGMPHILRERSLAHGRGRR